MTRPYCPACNGTRVRMTTGGEVACSSCPDGFMVGIDDETPEERRIAELSDLAARLERENAELRARLTQVPKHLMPTPVGGAE